MIAAQHLFQEWIASSQALRAIVPRNDGLDGVSPLIFGIRHPSAKYVNTKEMTGTGGFPPSRHYLEEIFDKSHNQHHV